MEGNELKRHEFIASLTVDRENREDKAMSTFCPVDGRGRALRLLLSSCREQRCSRCLPPLPEAIRAGQSAEKLLQFIDGSSFNGPDLSNHNGLSNLETTNSVGDPYPNVIDPRTGCVLTLKTSPF